MTMSMYNVSNTKYSLSSGQFNKNVFRILVVNKTYEIKPTCPSDFAYKYI